MPRRARTIQIQFVYHVNHVARLHDDALTCHSDAAYAFRMHGWQLRTEEDAWKATKSVTLSDSASEIFGGETQRQWGDALAGSRAYRQQVRGLGVSLKPAQCQRQCVCCVPCADPIAQLYAQQGQCIRLRAHF